MRGSPPQVRGKLLTIVDNLSFNRITPAGAGKTEKGIILECPKWDHPRGCGENFIDVVVLMHEEGSPPRVRGKLMSSLLFVGYIGITPAGAGKTTVRIIPAMPIKDHPRGCGENAELLPTSPFRQGSPPRVRGKPGFLANIESKVRITPAGAGKTKSFTRSQKR